MDPSHSFLDEEIVVAGNGGSGMDGDNLIILNAVESQQRQPQEQEDSISYNSWNRRRRLLGSSSSRSRTNSNNVASVVLDWTCMLVTVACLLVGLGYSWRTLHSSSSSFVEGQRQIVEQRPSHEDVSLLSERTAETSRTSPHSVSELDQVVSKTLVRLPETISGSIKEDEGSYHQPEPDGRLLDDGCLVNLHIDTICDGCDEWIADSGLQEWPWCHSELSSMTFQYTGCPCGTWYTIDYGTSTWNNATGQTSLNYECWKPNFLFNASEIPPEITCEDYILPPDDVAILSRTSGGGGVQWIATAADDANTVVGSGTVDVGEEYTITSNDPTTPLPAFVTVTFYDQDSGAMIQTSTFPTESCPGYPDPWYRHGYSQQHTVEVHEITTDRTISVRDTTKESLWFRITVEAPYEAVRLTELNVIVNINSEVINLTDAVYGVELNGNDAEDGDWSMITMESNNRRSATRNSIHSSFHSREEPTASTNTMTLMVGPMTMDMYWRTRYTAFGTIIAERADNTTVQCNGWDFHEYIAGLQ